MRINISEIKNKRRFLSYWKSFYKRKVLLLLIIIIGLISTFGIGLYLGADFYISGQAHSSKRWIQTLLNKPFSLIPNIINGNTSEPKQVFIDIKYDDFQQLAFQRELALTYGNKYRLHPENIGYVKAKISIAENNYKGKIKLKGGQLDHWGHPFKWSFKIKMSGDGRVSGMKYFSLQHPKTRSYINEWLLHKLFKNEKLISLNYEFVELIVNGKSYGIYALEENMDKTLIEHNNLREGAIVSFDTKLMWHKFGKVYDYSQASLIRNYTKSTTDSSITMLALQGSTLLEMYRLGKLTAEEVFDINKFAKFYAIIDLTGNSHSTALYNMKFYYNPVTSLLEPIGYDNGWFLNYSKGKLLSGSNINIGNSNKDFSFKDFLFRNKEFYKLYIENLNKITKKEYLDLFFKDIGEDLSNNIDILNKSYPWYNHDGEFEDYNTLYTNQTYIKEYLDSDATIQAFVNKNITHPDSISFYFKNIHSIPIEISSIRYKNEKVIKLSKKLTINPVATLGNNIFKEYTFSRLKNDSTFSKDSLFVTYNILGSSVSKTEQVIERTPIYKDFIKKDFIRQKSNFRESGIFIVDSLKKIIMFKAGDHDISRNLIIPSGYKVHAKSGTNINFRSEAKLLSYSPVYIEGNEEQPITISSSDRTGQGLIVMNANSKSLLKYVKFNNLAHPKQFLWGLPSSVTFYESDVNISYCTFSNNKSEDALNIFRSKFKIDNSFFINIQSDAFDADFCSGTLTGCSFIKIGNDAIDVSGTSIDVSNITIDKAGDKGLSAGESSIMNVKGAICTNIEIAVASKDKSLITITGSQISNCQIAFTCFQKKPEFGFSKIIAENITLSKIKIPYLIEEKSTMVLSGKKIEETTKDVKKIFYGNEYGKKSK